MNKNIVIVLVGGFVIALFVSIMVQSALKQNKPQPVTIEKVKILVAAKDLKVGHIIQKDDLTWQEWPKDNIFMGAIIQTSEQEPTEVVSGKLLRSLSEGQPVHKTVFASEEAGDFLSTKIKDGYRAVGLSVKKHIVADRLVKPGDYVDVIVTYRVRVNTRNNPQAQSVVNRYASETVIENVQILAIDDNAQTAVDAIDSESKNAKKSTKSSTTVTLEVSSEQAEKLVLADQLGSIHFAVRSYGDQRQVKTDKQTTDIGMSQVMTNLTTMNGGVGGGVRVYNGSQVDVMQTRATIQPQDSANFDLEDLPPEISPQNLMNVSPQYRGAPYEE